MSLTPNEFYEFGEFRVDVGRRLLLRSREVVSLNPKTFDVLLRLIRSRGEIVPYSDLIDSVWGPGAIASAKSPEYLREQITLLRKVLGDEPDEHRFIVTVPQKGYKFVADVRLLRRSRPRLRFVLWAALVAVVALTVVAVVRAIRSPVPLVEKQLTTNSENDPVTAGAISPDGKYLAYADRAGINIRQIESPATITIPANGVAEIGGLAWFRDGSNLLVTGRDYHAKKSDLWELSFFTRELRKLREDVSRAAASPDGKRVAFVDSSGTQVWIMSTNGDEPRIVFSGQEGDTVREVTWSPDGKHILLGKLHLGGFNAQVTIESIDQNGSAATIVKSDPQLRASCVTPEGHIIYAAAEPAPHENDTSLWEYERVDWARGGASRPRRIATWPGTSVYDLSVTSEGSRLVLLRGAFQADVYVGELQSQGVLRQEARRLTLDERNDLPTAWTPDSTTVIFHSDRIGKWSIYKQRIDETRAQVLVSGPNDYRGARISPDGRWLYYFERPRGYQALEWASPSRLISMSLESGQQRTVFQERAIFSFRCARAPSELCVLGERAWGKLSFYVLGPEGGMGRALSTVLTNAPLDQNYWDLSPDGKQIAMVIQGAQGPGRIRTFDVEGGEPLDVNIDGPSGFQSIDWSSDGEGWYISRGSAQGAEILFVNRQGRTKIVREQPRSFETWAVPSPDGKRLAILEWSAGTNAWMVDRSRR